MRSARNNSQCSKSVSRAARRRAKGGRRGVALLLVLVSLGVAGAATALYVASNDNSGAVGTNAAASVGADWAARSAADLAVAVMQTDEDWMTSALDGSLLKDFSVAGATVSVALTDINGDTPTADDTELIMTAVASVNGVRSVTQRLVEVRRTAPVPVAVDPALGEFGIFATERVELKSEARVGPWSASPSANFGKPAKLGAGFTAAGYLTIDAGANVRTTALYPTKTATSALRDMVKDPRFVGGGVIPLRVPATWSLLPGDFAPPPKLLPLLPAPDVDANGNTLAVLAGTYGMFEARSKGTIRMVPGDYDVAELKIDNGSVLEINGNVRIHVRGNATIHQSELRFADENATLQMYLAADLDVNDDCAVGMSGGDYIDPRRLQIYALSTAIGGKLYPVYKIRNYTKMCAAIHAPTANIEIDSRAQFFGRVTARYLRVDKADLYLDPSLDSGMGLTTFDGPLYADAAGPTPIDGLDAALDSFSLAAGIGALQAHLAAAFPPETVKATGLTPTITPRKAENADAREWPMKAIASEGDASSEVRVLSGGFTAKNAESAELGDDDGLDDLVDGLLKDLDGLDGDDDDGLLKIGILKF